MEVMCMCQDLSSGNTEEKAQMTLQTFLTEETSTSTAIPVIQNVPAEDDPGGLSSDEHPVPQRTIITGENSPTKKRKRAEDADSKLLIAIKTQTPPQQRKEGVNAWLPH